ncbi:MAG: insulinase family protein [Hyphomicrobiaceae bacterium]|nr:insulinase family protein [Hyphomicrobiaceae bacterium]
MPMLARVRPATLLTALIIMLVTGFATLAADSQTRATHFKLGNGMEVVVVPDHRAPVVTHMVWYRVGAADEPPGRSGIAHFLEHLMFKSTEKLAMGEFSRIVARLGGQDNAFTGQDATAYFQRISKAQLRRVMEMEADRMVNLRLGEKEVLTERDVILEERRSRVENNPSALLDEQMSAALYLNHPYRIPVIGWANEMAKLSRDDALTFYKRFYAPNNAILVVSGDVTAEEVRRLAEEIYGKLKPVPSITARVRPQEPVHLAPRHITLKDPRAARPTVQRYYLAPSYRTAKPGEAEAIELLMKIAASGSTSRMYKRLVVEKKVAASASGWYSGSGLDYGKIGLYAIAADGVPLDTLEQEMDAVVAEIRDKGVTAAELDRAKKAYLAAYIYESDSQATLARRYGWALVVGQTVKDVEEWPDRLRAVTVAQVKAAAAAVLDIRRSVTGRLVPVPQASARSGKTPASKPAKPSKS